MAKATMITLLALHSSHSSLYLPIPCPVRVYKHLGSDALVTREGEDGRKVSQG